MVKKLVKKLVKKIYDASIGDKDNDNETFETSISILKSHLPSTRQRPTYAYNFQQSNTFHSIRIINFNTLADPTLLTIPFNVTRTKRRLLSYGGRSIQCLPREITRAYDGDGGKTFSHALQEE